MPKPKTIASPTPLLLLALLLIGMLLAIATAQAAPGPRDKSDPTAGGLLANPGSELWRDVRQRDLPMVGTSQVKGVETGVLINSHGTEWAAFRTENPVRYAPWVLATFLVLVAAFYLLRGKASVEGGLSGRMVKRFTEYERIVHWTLAIVFLLLAITGLILLLGRPLLIPLLGPKAFALLASASKEGHNLFGPLFLVSLVLMLHAFARRNIYEKGDLTWLLKGGGFIGKGHVSGGFFNMGEKTWYWLVILIGFAVAVSGMVLVSPNFGQGRIVMELSHVVHVLGAIVLVAVSIGHMYLGSVGSEGSAEGMISGYVDINWANSHHDRWGKQLQADDAIIEPDEFTRRTGRQSGGST